MKILVCVKQVLDPRGMTVNRKAEKVFINREEYILDPASKAALETANHLKQGGAEVIAISVGLERVEDAIKTEEIVREHVNLRDFGWSPGARTWQEVYCVWRKVYMTKESLTERFGFTSWSTRTASLARLQSLAH